jgi:hypothetical protein
MEKKNFKHFLMTKFNVRFADWSTFRNSNTFGLPDWMNHRFQLFDRFCFPSIQNQTNKNFTWLVLFDRETRLEDRERIGKYQRQLAHMKTVYTTAQTLRQDVNEVIQQDSECEYVITTRIDNDDAYREDVIDTVQRKSVLADLAFINFCSGYKYSLADHRLYLYEDFSSPFMSLIEKKTDAIKTVQFEAHHLIKGRWPLHQIDGGRYWLQVIHDRNAVNAISPTMSNRMSYVARSFLNPRTAPAYLATVLFPDRILKGFNVSHQDRSVLDGS